jgi:hypothetical protein
MLDLLSSAVDYFTPTPAKKAVDSTSTLIDDIGNGLAEEGLMALFDPVGMLDRQDAKRDLAPYFGIVDDDFEGYRNHDQVTQEQFDEIARTYSDIRRGQGDLSINTDRIANPKMAAEYREARMHDIAMLMRTTSGREQIDFLNNAPDDVETTIQPRMKDKTGKEFVPAASCEQYDDRRIYLSNVEDVDGTPDVDGISYIILAHEMQHAHEMATHTQAAGTFGVQGHDDRLVENEERQATGLTNSDPAHPTDPKAATENRIRWELYQLGEDWLPRTRYDVSMGDYAGTEKNDKKRARAWREFLTSDDEHPGFER